MSPFVKMTKRTLEAIKNIIDDQSKIYFCYELKNEECHKKYDILKNSGSEIEIEESMTIWNDAYKFVKEAYDKGIKLEENFKKEIDKEFDIKQGLGILETTKLVNTLLLDAVKNIGMVEDTFNNLIAIMQTNNGELRIPEQAENLVKQIKDNKIQIESIYGELRESSQMTAMELGKKEVYKSRFKCGICRKNFKLKGTLNKHVRLIHGAPLRKIEKCKECIYSTERPYDLGIHVKAIHQDVQHKCEKCQKKFRWKKTLKRHERQHHVDLGQFWQRNQCTTWDTL